jgi:cobyrinic acid a,c-diamide synthase
VPLRGGVGEMIVSLAIIKDWQQNILTIAPFKQGPDFIDALWLKEWAGRNCYNLDTFLIPRQSVFDSFACCSQGADGPLLEGNRDLMTG